MEWYIWVGVVVTALWLLSMAFDPPRRRKRNNTQSVTDEAPSRSVINTQYRDTNTSLFDNDLYRIAGITFRCQPSDVGGFFGTVEPQPDNPHDPEALAIYRDDGKLLGYIPAADHQRFKERFGPIDGGRLYLVGFIAVDTLAPIYGRVLVFAGNSVDEDRKLQERFVEWITTCHGKDFTPRRFENPV